ncbi:MAG: UbiA family prenyltransferase [Syntrophobacteraceae bacterium]|nr:UbiA family prenyltransferase [Syntrophobacteraceae bacterium]
MSTTSVLGDPGISRLKLFMALSRTPHGVLDMATPALGALLYLGTVPPLPVVLLGILTAFAGYTAVYALNDVVDYRVDREKVQNCGLPEASGDLDAVCARHPIAQGLLSLREGILWTVSWGAVALLGAYLLNPKCAIIFIGGCVAEAVYCLMLRVSYLRTLVSGVVKTAGGMAAVYAVAPDPSPFFLVVFFLWLFFWEVGGQNVPNDWADMKEDQELQTDTIPVRFGVESSASIIVVTLSVAVLLSVVLYWVTPAQLSPLYLPGVVGAGILLLLRPASRLKADPRVQSASALFNQASTYPLAFFVVVLISSILA